MKFTKEDARKELVSRIPGKGQTLNLSERSINEQLETLMPLLADDETELEDFIVRVLPVFKTADGNVKNDVASGIRTYKEQNPEPKKEPKKNDGDDGKKDANAELLRRIEELEKLNAENAKKTTLSERRSTIAAKMNEKGCKDKEWIESFLDLVSLDGEEFDADVLADSYIKVYNKKTANPPRNVTPKNAGGSGNDSYLDEVIKAAAEKNKTSVLGQ